MPIDNSAYITSVTASSKTQSFTVGSESNRYLLVATVGTTGGSDIITGVAYNGVAMTKIGSSIQATGNRWIALWRLINPASGSNNIVISASGSDWIEGLALSFSDMVQSAPEASNTGTSASASSLSIAVTPTSTYSYVIGVARTGSSTGTASTNTSYIVGDGADGSFSVAFVQRSDNPRTSTSSTSVAWTTSGATSQAGIAVALGAIDYRVAGGIFFI